jgi:hypothetical protein
MPGLVPGMTPDEEEHRGRKPAMMEKQKGE